MTWEKFGSLWIELMKVVTREVVALLSTNTPTKTYMSFCAA